MSPVRSALTCWRTCRRSVSVGLPPWDSRGAPQNSPVGFRYNADLGTIDIGGRNMGASRKFRNLAGNPNVAFVVDDIASIQPWRVRCVEIRGHAEALRDEIPLRAGYVAGDHPHLSRPGHQLWPRPGLTILSRRS